MPPVADSPAHPDPATEAVTVPPPAPLLPCVPPGVATGMTNVIEAADQGMSTPRSRVTCDQLPALPPPTSTMSM
ncbi:Uncharacterised protein [Mycobacteroides abscessus subsp. abscessus]|nr:Uncharacterised protein [Mycobacteroides abscessus subsp. abscessus]